MPWLKSNSHRGIPPFESEVVHGIILTRLSGRVMFTLFSGQRYQGKNTPYELDNMKTFKELGGF